MLMLIVINLDGKLYRFLKLPDQVDWE
ncbi:uncharacterized protein METZ01_LOCUS71776 [marine metagenome]|uniref:Uncharacterized protein n=1 Tax=marine metagenome TaxID=408172 RepID=A0A381TS91_9ZZZZ